MYRLKKIGEIKPVASRDVIESKIGLGFEKLDRDVFDPELAYDYVAATGVKWIRIQSGWARTEKSKGVYDFAWLDRVVDKLIEAGCRPWVCLCYGNGLYDEDAAKVFGGVGCVPNKNDEQKAAWSRYVTTLVARYRGRVAHFEIWNEPDGGWCWKKFRGDEIWFDNANAGREYGEFVIATTAAIRAGNPEAKAIAGSMCGNGLWWLSDVARTGCFKDVWGFTYHCYSADETDNPLRVRMLRAFFQKYNPAIKIIQGESGSQSRPDGKGALRGLNWTEEKQAKQLLRHTVSDLLCDVEFMSFFSCMDMVEALNGRTGDKASYLDYGYFGVLSAQFDADGRATGAVKPKMSYRALQNVAALFREMPEVCEMPVFIWSERSDLVGWWRNNAKAQELAFGGFRRGDDSKIFVYWKPTDLINMSVTETVSPVFADCPGIPRLADPLTGAVYEIPESMAEKMADGCWKFKELPLFDYPLVLAWGDFFEYQ